ncbi:ATP-binding cassette domain-containing protein [Ponticoccus alexandrii]|uniref:ATP-binding cassette domain-containing protein n=1 Tax=Ponticoccus alexandrii TaxID=1943633 RepID=A0ABX7F7I7_9RHOB|nr:ATP-binding cassette domain-containing protein [Ponticoccus alexandrii]QRF66220.1 ATP-binding cassette domain-containing protein [Ponticoccus alexandrii]
MIEVRDMTLMTPGLRHRRVILSGASFRVAPGDRLGILAAPGSGKSTLARVLSGIDRPDGGSVRRQGRVSWPIGFAGFLHPELTVAENLATLARLVGLSARDVTGFCTEFTGIADLAGRRMKTLTPTQRATLAYACALCVPGPATWIADEVISVGEPHHRRLCDRILAERLDEGALVFLSRNARQLKIWCDRFMVLIAGRLVPCDDLDVAQQALELEAASRLAEGRGAA